MKKKWKRMKDGNMDREETMFEERWKAIAGVTVDAERKFVTLLNVELARWSNTHQLGYNSCQLSGHNVCHTRNATWTLIAASNDTYILPDT
jgi:hypothetical protein